jgi:hypothetical protein
MIYSKSEFAKLCGMRTSNLTNYVKRGKVILTGSDKVDDSLEINKDFLSRHQSKQEVKQPEEPQEKRLRMIKPDHGIEDLPDTPDIEDEEADEPEAEDSAPGLYKKKLKVEIEKKEREIALLKLREEKLTGEIVPIDKVKDLFTQHSKAGAVVVKNTIDNILTRVAQMAGLNVNQIAEIRGAAIQEINSGINKTVEETRKRVNVLQMQHSEKREVGERNGNG